MALSVGELNAKLTLDDAQFNGGVDRAKGKMGLLEAASSKVGSVVGGTLKAGIGVANTVAAAVGVWTVNTLKTGLAYNTLQQTSRAALKTILGSSEAVNAQMDKLDAFAKNSPFGKDIFIKGQQQMLSFGTATDKVIPRLDALQNAVAAAGGSGQTLSELIFVMSQIQAAGKITAEDLNQFGQRGVNAADMIGASMGKTGNEIRTMISKGKLDANQALDALTQGMASKFAGASANVKQTWSGTVDRIKAATREIGAALAQPWISQAGGGVAVTWGNKVADILQVVRGNTAGVVDALMLRAVPALKAVDSGLDKVKSAAGAINADNANKLLDVIQRYAPAVGLAAGAWGGLSANMLGGIPIIGQYLAKLNPLTTAVVGLAVASPELRSSLIGLVGAFSPLIKPVQSVTTLLADGLNVAVPAAASGIGALTGVVSPLVGMLSQIPTPVLAGVAAFVALQRVAPSVQSGFSAVTEGVKSFAASMRDNIAYQQTLYQGAVFNGQAEGSLSRLGAAGAAVKTSMRGIGDSIMTAFGGPTGLAIAGVALAVTAVTAAFAASAEKTKKQQQATEELKGSLTDAGDVTSATAKKISSSLQSVEMSSWTSGVSKWSDAIQQAGGYTEDFTGELVANAAKFGSFSDAASAAGTSISDITSAITSGGPAYDNLLSKLDAQAAGAREGDEASQDLAAASAIVADQMREQAGSLDGAQKAQLEANQKMAEGKAALAELQGGFDGATEASDAFADAIKGLGSKQLDLNAANRKFKEAVDQATQSIRDNGATLDDNSAAGRKNGDALDAIAQKAQVAAAAIYQTTGNQADASAKLVEGRDAYIKAAEAMGKNSDEAARMADQLGLTADSAGKVADAVQKANGTELKDKSFKVSDDGTIQWTQQSVDALNKMGLPDKKLVVDSDTAKAYQGIDGVNVTKVDDKTFVVTGDNQDGWNKIDEINGAQTPGKTLWIWGDDADAANKIQTINGTAVPDKLLKIPADAMEAYSKIDGVNMKQVDPKTAYVWGNNSDAWAKIGDVQRAKDPEKTAWIDGNTDKFYDAWNGIKSLGNIVKNVVVNWIGGGDGPKANGGTVGFATGGTIPAFAGGGSVPGLNGGLWDGTVFGAGTSKSDSILVRLSRGEEVIQEPYASRHRGLLKRINQGLDPQRLAVGGTVGDDGGQGSRATSQDQTTVVSVTQNITTQQDDPRVQMRQWSREAEKAFAGGGI